jgi:hypothetical protein
MMQSSEELLVRWLQHKAAKRVDEYLKRGRHLASFTDDELDRRWVVECKSWIARIEEEAECVALNDLQAEFRLRHRAPPNRLVRDEFKGLIEKRFSRLVTSGTIRRLTERMVRDLEEYGRDTRKRSLH